MRALPVGLENLHIFDEEEVDQVQKALNTSANYVDKSVAWRKGEMEFEAWMRMLDSQVILIHSWMSSRNPYSGLKSASPSSGLRGF